MEYSELLALAGIYSSRHAAAIGLTKYLYDKARKNEPINPGWVRYLQLRAGADPDWPGFRIGAGIIETPSGEIVHRNEIDQLHYQRQLAYERGKHEADKAQLQLVWSR